MMGPGRFGGLLDQEGLKPRAIGRNPCFGLADSFTPVLVYDALAVLFVRCFST